MHAWSPTSAAAGVASPGPGAPQFFAGHTAGMANTTERLMVAFLAVDAAGAAIAIRHRVAGEPFGVGGSLDVRRPAVVALWGTALVGTDRVNGAGSGPLPLAAQHASADGRALRRRRPVRAGLLGPATVPACGQGAPGRPRGDRHRPGRRAGVVGAGERWTASVRLRQRRRGVQANGTTRPHPRAMRQKPDAAVRRGCPSRLHRRGPAWCRSGREAIEEAVGDGGDADVTRSVSPDRANRRSPCRTAGCRTARSRVARWGAACSGARTATG